MALEDMLGDDSEFEQAARTAEREADIPDQPKEEKREEPAEKTEASGDQEADNSGDNQTEDGPKDGDSGKPPKGYVPHAALHEERQQRKQLQQQMQEMNQRVQQFEQLRNELQDFRARQQQQQQQLTDEQAYQEDPVGFLRQQNERLQQRLQSFEQGIHQTQESYQQAQQQQEAVQQIVGTVRAQEDVFRKDHPDYDDAFNYLQNTIMEDFDLYGVSDPAQKQQEFYRQVLQASVQALQQERNPAEVMYELAKRRGYTAKQAQQKLDSAKRGQKASTTLSEGGGGGHQSVKGPSLNDIAEMSDDDFDKLWDEMNKAARGGR